MQRTIDPKWNIPCLPEFISIVCTFVDGCHFADAAKTLSFCPSFDHIHHVRFETVDIAFFVYFKFALDRHACYSSSRFLEQRRKRTGQSIADRRKIRKKILSVLFLIDTIQSIHERERETHLEQVETSIEGNLHLPAVMSFDRLIKG